MKKAWKQTWKNLLFQHFELKNIEVLKKFLPKDCEFDSFHGKYYLGLVSMDMTNVKHKLTGNFVWFKKYNELNVRTYIVHNNKPGVLFLSLDVNSFISFLGARALYGLPYRMSKFDIIKGKVSSFRNSKLPFEVKYTVNSKLKVYEEGSFAYWSTERYFFANKYLGFSFKGEINHKPWQLSTACVKNQNLDVLNSFEIVNKHPDILYCEEISLQTSKLTRIK